MINLCRSALMMLMLWLIFKQEISLGQFFSLLFYSFAIFNPLSELSTVATQYQEAKASNEILDGILNMKPEESINRVNVIDKISSLDFKDVTFSYGEENQPTLKNISLGIHPGETIAFAGPSGSGKTSLIKLLLGLYQPTSGSIEINNLDLQTITADSFKQKISYVSQQDTQLFAGTIRANLRFVNPKATDEECLEALKHAAALSLLKNQVAKA